MMFRCGLTLAVLLSALMGAQGAVIAYWNFNSAPPDTNVSTGTLAPAWGAGTAELVGAVTDSFTASNGSSDTAVDNSNWRISDWPPQGTGNKSHGVRFTVSTVGYRNVRVGWDLRNSNTASKFTRLQYSTNGTDFLDHQVIMMPAETWIHEQVVSLANLPGVENNPHFALRFVTEFENTATGAGLAGYVPSNPGSTYGAAGTLRFDMVTLSGEPIAPDPNRTFTLLNYNVWGADATDWSTNNPQVRAVGRQLAYLAPDIITLQEIPNIGLTNMPNIVATYLPGYYLATNRTSDGDKGNLIVSRFPILRSWSRMGRSSLAAWGFNGVFTRDLFEAEIAVPELHEPVHVFSVHLKAFNDEVSAPRRAAEASAISNYFATVFLPARGHRPYVLAGDFNEDIYRPRSFEQGAMQRIINAATGLHLTTPLNPFNHDERTWSSRNPNPTIRFDYILPGTNLFQNTVTNWIFRTDFLNPTPPQVLANDSQVATDHLPLLAVYRNADAQVPPPPSVFFTKLRIESPNAVVSWDSVIGRKYSVQGAFHLTNWITLSSLITATDTNTSWQGSLVPSGMYFRVLETP